MKEIIKVLMPCSNCGGRGKVLQDLVDNANLHKHNPGETCSICKGSGRQEIREEHPEYAKYYRITLKRKRDIAMDKIMSAEKHYSKSLENYDLYINLLRKLDMQERKNLK